MIGHTVSDSQAEFAQNGRQNQLVYAVLQNVPHPHSPAFGRQPASKYLSAFACSHVDLFVLAGHNETGRYVRYPDCTVGCVDAAHQARSNDRHQFEGHFPVYRSISSAGRMRPYADV